MVQAKDLGGLRKPPEATLWLGNEAVRTIAALAEGGTLTASSGSATAQQAAHGAPEQQARSLQPGSCGRPGTDACNARSSPVVGLAACAAAISVAGKSTLWTLTASPPWSWPAWADATDGANANAISTKAAPKSRAS